ncbi:MAG: SDR family NAD(P)-dependent oxidoreductase [Bacteroidetes bacterium]|nr:SDR family NAD(P)-dependent oxidoreductase [Bacteroidota bacterium]
MLTLITGATAGIGSVTAEVFAENHYDVIITGRRNERLLELQKSLVEKFSVNVKILCFDIRDRKQVEKSLHSLTGKWNQIDVLVNNAGLASGLSHIQDGDITDWETMIDTNIKGLLYVTRIIAPGMVKRGTGHIINVGSIAGKEVYEKGNVYCATKHAVEALSKGMRIDLLKHGIKVTNIAPGMVETEFSLVRFKGDAERAKKTYQGLSPLTAADVADAIFWCATRPPHVNINDLLIMPAVQAGVHHLIRKNQD